MLTTTIAAWLSFLPATLPAPEQYAVNTEHNDTFYAQQWGLHEMNFPLAWKVSPGHSYIGLADATPDNSLEDVKQNIRTHLSTNYSTNSNSISNILSQCLYNNSCINLELKLFSNNSTLTHGTMTAGVIGAAIDNSNGISGACPTCSIIHNTIVASQQEDEAQESSKLDANAIFALAVRGVQILNLSLGYDPAKTCYDPGTAPRCQELLNAMHNKDVLIVAAAGNHGTTSPEWPANIPGVLSVGGAQYSEHGWQRWVSGLSTQDVEGSAPEWKAGTQYGTANPGFHGVIAPAHDIFTTFSKGGAYNKDSGYWFIKCADADALPDNDGINRCSGTSFAAPYISSLAGIIRSINPRLSSAGVIKIIQESASKKFANGPQYTPTMEFGHGMPDARIAAIRTAISTPSRLTPLFTMKSEKSQRHFYTSVPQMAAAARAGNLEPRLISDKYDNQSHLNYIVTVLNSNTHQYVSSTNYRDTQTFCYYEDKTCFYPPSDVDHGWAAYLVFTTPHMPKHNIGRKLVPLYRLSRLNLSQPIDPYPHTYPEYRYTTSETTLNNLRLNDYQLDGIEGYLIPEIDGGEAGGKQVLIASYHNMSTLDNALFETGKEPTGYTHTETLGWAYRAESTPDVDMFKDVNKGHWAHKYIEALRLAEISNGCDAQGNYCPDNLVTRGEMAAFMIRTVEGEPSMSCGDTAPFPDVASTDWNCAYIKRMAALGITQGSNGYYLPNDNVTRAQMAAFLVRGLQKTRNRQFVETQTCSSTNVPFTDVPANDPMCPYIQKIKELGITKGYADGTFKPNNPVTRAEMATFISRAYLGL